MTIADAARGYEAAARPPRRRRSGPHTLILPIVVLAVLAMLATSFVAYVLWPRWPGAEIDAGAPALPIVVAGVTFNVPPAAIRVVVQRRPGTQERLDLAFAWPSLEPAGSSPKKKLAESLPAPMQALERIFLTIMVTGSSVAPADRVLTIYPRYTASESTAGPAGLAVLSFRDGTPYQGEDLIYDSQAPGFVVRCTRTLGLTPGTCLYERWIDGAKLVLRFPRHWLEDWRGLVTQIDLLISRLRPH